MKRPMPDFLAEVLTWSKNYYNLMAVQTAVKMGLPPTSMLSDKQPSEGWSREDRKLAIALTIMERETCSKCGQQIWICRSTDKNLLFQTKKATCYATAQSEKDAKSNQFKAENLKPGEYTFVVPYMYGDDQTLPSRSDYLASLVDED